MAVLLVAFVLALLVSTRGQLEENARPVQAGDPHIGAWESLRSHVSPSFVKATLQNNTKYNSRFPFPYAVIDNFFPADIMRRVESEIPDSSRVLNGCVKNASVCVKTTEQHYRNIFELEHTMGTATTAVLAFLKSSFFVRFLEQLSGIEGLIADSHNRGAGVHQTLSGGFMHVHADPHRHEKYDLHRRVVVFVYLNPDWEDRFGGHLEFWSRNLKTCFTKIRPDLNRMVVFSTSDYAYHGYPNPVLCPKHRTRRSLAMYYYSASRQVSECWKGDCLSRRPMTFVSTACKSCGDKRCISPIWAN